MQFIAPAASDYAARPAATLGVVSDRVASSHQLARTSEEDKDRGYAGRTELRRGA